MIQLNSVETIQLVVSSIIQFQRDFTMIDRIWLFFNFIIDEIVIVFIWIFGFKIMKNQFSSFKFKRSKISHLNHSIIKWINFNQFHWIWNECDHLLNYFYSNQFERIHHFRSVWSSNIFLIDSIHQLRRYSIIQRFFKVVSISLSSNERRSQILFRLFIQQKLFSQNLM